MVWRKVHSISAPLYLGGANGQNDYDMAGNDQDDYDDDPCNEAVYCSLLRENLNEGAKNAELFVLFLLQRIADASQQLPLQFGSSRIYHARLAYSFEEWYWRRIMSVLHSHNAMPMA